MVKGAEPPIIPRSAKSAENVTVKGTGPSHEDCQNEGDNYIPSTVNAGRSDAMIGLTTGGGPKRGGLPGRKSARDKALPQRNTMHANGKTCLILRKAC